MQQLSLSPINLYNRQPTGRYPQEPFGTLNDKELEVNITLLNKNNLSILLKTYRLAMRHRTSLCAEQRNQIQSLLDSTYFNLNHPSFVHIKLHNAKPDAYHTRDNELPSSRTCARIEERLLETHHILTQLLNDPTPISKGLLEETYNAIVQQKLILFGQAEAIKAKCAKYDTHYTLSKIERLLKDAEKIPKPGGPFAQTQKLIQRLMESLMRR